MTATAGTSSTDQTRSNESREGVFVPEEEILEAALSRGVVLGPRPWVRFIARAFDTLLFMTPVLIVGYTVLHALDQDLARQCFSTSLLRTLSRFVLMIAYIGVEALALGTLGTTPGKFLLGVSVRTTDGQKPAVSIALKRSVLVWALGTGLGLPVIQPLAMLYWWWTLSPRRPDTQWDLECGLEVSYSPIHPGRALAFGTLFAMLYAGWIWVYWDTIAR